MNSLINDLRRIANGVSLVAKEIVRRSDAIEIGRESGVVESLVKKTVVSVTDLSGLTRGRVQRLESSRDVKNDSDLRCEAEDKVVYFNQDDAGGAAPGGAMGSIKEEVVDESHRVVASLSAGDAASGGAGASEQVSEAPESQSVGATGNADAEVISVASPLKRRKPRERKVPSTPFSRALGFASLGAGLAWGTVQESAKRLVFGRPNVEDEKSTVSPFLSERNAERLALALCRMRGAALKLGQMLSIQDESLVPAPILAALEIVRQGADVMPRSQLNHVLDAELGPDWSSKLSSFNYEPIASASIGQVHEAVTHDGLRVAMKIQYPGVAESIESDIENVKLLLDYTNLIPKGLFLDRAMKVAKEELALECDYILEAKNQQRFRNLLSNKQGFYVPLVLKDLSSRRVLTTELVSGIPIDKVALLDQDTRNYVGKKLLELTLMELFVFHFMQTDPNWGNFLYDGERRLINLIDFGAARDYPKSFIDDYLRMVVACANCDRDAVIEMSKRLGFLTGTESEIMLDAHVQAAFVVGLPFSRSGVYDFRSTNVTHSLSNLGATMLKHRLTPPPDEAYSLHRKLSGAFLACIKLGAVVPCREMLFQVYEHHKFGDDNDEILLSGKIP